MKRNTKIVKKIVALFLVLLLSIESLAAVVSDNDGSAFITKAEFDSLKNDFQAQLDSYNTSIDSKIDNAIASYLQGIKVGSEREIFLPESILEWPITLYADSPFDYDKHYGEGSYNYASGTAQWTPFFQFANTINRILSTGVFYASNDNDTNAWSTFYNYESTYKINGIKYGIITNVIDDYRATYDAQNWIMSFNQTGQHTDFQSCIVCGITEAYKLTSGDAYYGSGRTYGLVQSGTRYGIAGKTNGTALQFDYALTYTSNLGTSESLTNTSATTRQWSVGTGGWQIATATYNSNPMWAIQYEIGKFNKLFNNTGYYVPVTYKNEVYLTNYHTAFRNLFTGNVTTIKVGNVGLGNPGITWTCTRYDSPNFTIADINHCNKTDQFDTSFIKSDNLAYVCTDVDGDVIVPMTAGQYLGKMEDDGKLKITLNLNYTGSKVRVILRKEPIFDTDINDDKNVLINYEALKNQKYAEIGNNIDTQLTIDVSKNDMIYIKAINGIDQDIVFNRPTMRLSTDS